MRNVYERTVVVNNNRVSYNGGAGGIDARPTREEERYSREPHREALAVQMQHERAASQNRQSFASENHGRPAIAATGRPGELGGRNVALNQSRSEQRPQQKTEKAEHRGQQEQRRQQQERKSGEREERGPGR